MREIILINPPLLKKELYGELGSAGSAAYPLGLCSLASVIRERGFGVSIIDAPALGLDLEATLKETIDNNPDFVGITAVTITIERAAKLAQEIKRHNPDITIILGGPHLTAVPEDTFRRYPHFDLGVIGEGEITISELLENLKPNYDLANIHGIIFRKGQDIIKTAPRDFIEDLDTLPMPAWDLLPELPRYYHPTVYSFNRLPSTHLVTSRGCPGRCSFCDTAVFGSKYRYFSSEYVIKMILYLYNVYGMRDILFDDDLFIGNRKKLIEICDFLKSSKLDLSWSCNARIDLMTMEMLQYMKDAGCWQIAYGIESGSQRMLDSMNKNITLEQIEKVLKWTSQLKIRTKGFFMMGLPGETREDILKTIDFAKGLELVDFQINFFTPLPGSEEYRRAKNAGFTVKSWGELNLHTEPVFVPQGLTKAELMRLNKKAFKEFYLRPKIIFSYLKLIRNWEGARKLAIGAFALIRFWLIGKRSLANSSGTNRHKYETKNILVKILLKNFFKKLSSFVKTAPLHSRILDCGCAEGFVMNSVGKSRKDILLFGVDNNLSALKEARKRNPAAFFVQADARFLPFKDGVFTETLSLEILEHIDGDPIEALLEIKRVSLDRIIASVPNEPLFSLSNLIMGRRIRYLGKDPEHKHNWSKRSFLKLLDNCLITRKVVLPFPWIMVEAVKDNSY